jgi:hypothetical protein
LRCDFHGRNIPNRFGFCKGNFTRNEKSCELQSKSPQKNSANGACSPAVPAPGRDTSGAAAGSPLAEPVGRPRQQNERK